MSRVYSEYNIILSESVVQTLTLYNSLEMYANETTDFLFLQFLLVAVYGGDAYSLEDAKMNFVKKIFEIRAKGNNYRQSKFVDHVTKINSSK